MRIKRFIIFAILIVIVIPYTIALPSIIKEEINEQEPLWGVAYLDVRVKEEYGNPENPQYRYLPNVTVYFWQYFKIAIPFVYRSNLISPIVKKSIFIITAIEISKTYTNGCTSIGGHSWTPLLLVYVEKEGYHTISSPFRTGRPLCNYPYPTVNFIMKKTE